MSVIGNLSLRLANGAAEDAENAWRRHKRGCPPCSTAQRGRKPEDMCGEGQRLYLDRNITAAELVRERQLARQPDPNQAPLFDLEAS